jgi:ABC-type transport system involved in multi-copper enzyme maturation permease subunit
VLELEKLRLLRGRALGFVVISAVFVVLVSLAARQAGALPLAVENETASLGILRFLALLAPCALAGGAISEELAARTLVYLTVRPLPRALVVAGKWLASALSALVVVAVTALAVHLTCFVASPSGVFSGIGHALAIAAAAGAEALVCTGICLAYGALAPRGGGMLAFAHIAFFELLMSFAPGRLRLVSMAHHALGLAGLHGEGAVASTVPVLSPTVHALVLAGAILGWLGLAALVFSVSEYRGSESE